MKRRHLQHRFVEFIPERLEDGVLYVSMEYATVVHLCCCGCGREVVTPLGPTDWRIMFDGKSVSLEPSIGSWSLPCKSHYWISDNEVSWARAWTHKEIRSGRLATERAKRAYFEAKEEVRDRGRESNAPATESRWWHRLKHFIRDD